MINNPSVPSEHRNSLLRRWAGRLTESLRLEPGGHGLGQVPARLKPNSLTSMVCGYCATGCSLEVHLKEGEPVNLSPTQHYPVNLGMACPKGWEALAPLKAPDRAVAPLIRDTGGRMVSTDWEAAARLFVERFKGLMAEHGNESVAVLSTGQICTEEMALLGAVFKFGMGGIHADSNTRQCMATANTAYKQSFGFDAPPFTYADFELSDTLVFVGANPCIAHPIMWQRVLRNPNHPKIIVLDPRRTETAMNASTHLALRPKSDLCLLYGVANLIALNGWTDVSFIERHTRGFAEFSAFVRQFTPDKVAAATGLTVGEIYRFAAAIHLGKAVSFWWTMGVNQSHEATRTAQAIINLALMTGNIGRPGTGPNSITGQCNAMGSRLFSNTSGLLGGRDFLKPEHRRQVAEALRLPLEAIPDCNSLAYDQILQGIEAGVIKGLWVVGTNPAHSWIDRSGLDRLLDKLEFLVVQDMFTTTETARKAHLLLPAAGWGEKEGSFVNAERRLGCVRPIARAPGLALSDFEIVRLLARAWGCGEMFADWSSPAAAFQILKRLSQAQPCDITGIRDYAHLEAEGGIQWPLPEPPSVRTGATGCAAESIPTSRAQSSRPPDTIGLERERRLFCDGRFFHPDGRARFLFDPPRPMPELTDQAYSFLLLTGRGSSAQWHTGTRTEKSAVLRALRPARIYVEIHPEDARRLGITAQSRVRVQSRRGELIATACLTPSVQLGQLFIPMHYAATNRLTLGAFDPHSRQPAYKGCAVRIESCA